MRRILGRLRLGVLKYDAILSTIHWPADAFIDWTGHRHVAPGDGLRLLGDAAVKDCDDNKDRGKLGNRAQSLAKREEGLGLSPAL